MDSEEIVDAVRDFLDDDDWKYEYDAERKIIRADIILDCKLKHASLRIKVRETSYNVYISLPINADKDTLPNVIRYTTMANYGLIPGNFEVDVEDGEVRFRTFVNADGLSGLPTAVIKDSIYCGWNIVEHYGDGLAALIMGFSDVETEIEKAEKK